MMGSRDDVDDVAELNNKIYTFLNNLFNENEDLQPVAIFFVINLYFLELLTTEERKGMRMIFQKMQELAAGNDLKSPSERTAFVTQMSAFFDKATRGQ